jgi:hypothetical protein
LHFPRDTWCADSESIVEHVAGIEDYQVALATVRPAARLSTALSARLADEIKRRTGEKTMTSDLTYELPYTPT